MIRKPSIYLADTVIFSQSIEIRLLCGQEKKAPGKSSVLSVSIYKCVCQTILYFTEVYCI